MGLWQACQHGVLGPVDGLLPQRVAPVLTDQQGHEHPGAAGLDEGADVGIDHELGSHVSGAAGCEQHRLRDEQGQGSSP